MSAPAERDQRISPRELLEHDGQLTDDVVAVLVNGEVQDLHTPVPSDARVEPLRENDERALEVIRHSTSHVMADAVQRLFPATQVTFGPATEDGFFYDFDRKDGHFSEADLEKIEETMRDIIAADLPFRREAIDKQRAIELFEKMGEKYKAEHVRTLEGEISLYRHGDWVDLCSGPHVPSTRFLRAVKLTSVAGAYWRGDERNPMLQRIYGTAFPSEKALRKHLQALEEAKKRDHRKLGRELQLFAFHPWAPASPFFLRRGASVYNALVDYIRALYTRYGYEEIITPQIFDTELFRTSGHLPSYGTNMFGGVTEDSLDQMADEIAKMKSDAPGEVRQRLEAGVRYGVKPMNCPGHCLMFGMTRRSYRELPLRVADFGRLHRYERSGVVQGLTRVRTFSQDDAHIFCTLDQVQGEIVSFINLVHEAYEDFGFTDMRIVVATRPDDRIGDDAIWDRSEKALMDAVDSKGLEYEVAEGEGAFYGPKVEFHLKDALGRPWQLGTIQADFILPERFELSYVGEDNKPHRPVMLHRAILGSVERFFAVLIEHCGGAFPTWLAPEQVILLTVSEKVDEYAREAVQHLRDAGIRAVADLSSDKLGAKIRNARHMRHPYLAVVGPKEAVGRGVSLRSRDEQKDLGFMSLDDLVQRLQREGLPPSRQNG